ncbi:response regulator transcription factor [Tenacibaculum sp. M341]|uniref:response regulator transcription factor n=1 Tax=Tenacibaculum sp. M341 TaxID=2530339 RepID=UPI00104E80EC|nr:LuxR C-terminal-related transcriptional regulator [Tenacibaculum sp. M341]TCI94355.1 response regulator transcription factor [Tenacibaculum sp. M341]
MCKRFVFIILFTISSFAFSKNAPLLKSYLKPINHSASYNIKKASYDFRKEIFNRNIKKNSSESYLINENNTILTIKLDSVKQLHEKKLLRKDIQQNTIYYSNFLDDLKKSNINSSKYIFLENELLKINVATANKKYKFTSIISFFLITVIALLVTFILKSRKKKTPSIDLTNQEITIKELIINGKTNKEIANELHISLNTVKTHISNLYQKLNISNRRELIVNSKK